MASEYKESVTVRIPISVLEQVDRVCGSRKWGRSAVITEALERYFESENRGGEE